MVDLSQNHRRRVLSTLRYLDQVLDETEHIMASARSRSAFPRYAPDATPVQCKVVSDHIARFREAMLGTLPGLGLAPGTPETSVLRALRVQIITAEIALEDMNAGAMAGYGPLSPPVATALVGAAAELRGRLEAIGSFLDEPPDKDLQARLQRLAETTGEAELAAELERAVTAHGLVELRPALAMVVERMESPRFEVAVFGRVSSGKSSLLNYVLGCPALPVGVTPITAVPTRLAFGREERVVVEFAERAPVVMPLPRLAEVATEQQNPGNRKHVTRINVELPAARLESGVTFVDTPGLGSLAAAGAEETLAYLPHCDLGIVLVDAASSLGPHEIAVVRALYQGGATAAVLLSKADLLSPAEQDQVVRYARELIASECGVGVPVSPVSVVGPAAALADEWFDAVLQPLCQKQEEMAATALRRKVGALRDAAVAALRHRLERGRGGARLPAPDAEGAVQAFVRASALFDGTAARCEALASRLEATAEPVIEAAAAVTAARWQAHATRAQIAQEALTDALSRQAEAVAQEIVAELTRLRDELAKALDLAAAAAAPGRETPDLPRIAGLPVIDGSQLGPEIALDRFPLAVLGGAVRRRGVAARLRAQVLAPLRRLLEFHRRRLAEWSRSVVAELRQSFDSQAGVLRPGIVARGGGAAAGTAEELSAMERDVALLSEWGRVHGTGGTR